MNVKLEVSTIYVKHNMDWSREHTGLSDSMDLCVLGAAWYEPNQEIYCHYEPEKPSEFS
jgi:hypothetical protein